MTEEYYTRLEEPLQARKQLLETSRIMVLLLQRFETLQEKRKQRIGAIEKLKTLLKETHDLLDQLRKTLPQVKIPLKTETKQEKKQEKTEDKQTKEQPYKTRDLDKIEAELRRLEIKLKALS